MVKGWSAPSRGRHVYVVLRWDDRPGTPSLDDIVATKAYETISEAEAEAGRLNTLNASKGARYFVRVARLQGPSDIARR
jgi:hypothetical protein